MSTIKKQRIWELDALRGFCILCVIVVHLIVDLQDFLGLQLNLPPLYQFIQSYGGIIFVILSGVCITLGSRSLRRGLIVFTCAMGVTLVTWAMVQLGMAGPGVIIRFGVLHLLGVCMLVYPLFKKLPTPALAPLAVCLVVLGYVFRTVQVEAGWLFPLGLTAPGFSSADYFPLLPHLGWFLLGVVLGRTFYADKTTRFPQVNADFFLIRFFCFCGRQSLWIYLAHQPVMFGVIQLILLLR